MCGYNCRMKLWYPNYSSYPNYVILYILNDISCGAISVDFLKVLFTDHAYADELYSKLGLTVPW